MYVRMYVCMYVCTCICWHSTPGLSCMHICMYICTCVRTYIHIHTYVCPTYESVLFATDMCVHMHTYFLIMYRQTCVECLAS